MKIAFNQNYGKVYLQDGMFEPEKCKLSNNLLEPNIRLRAKIESNGDELHTLDVYNSQKIDVIIFQDMPLSILTISSLSDLVVYTLKRILKNKCFSDPLMNAIKMIEKRKIILLITEPPVVNKKSYNLKYYKYFGKIVSYYDLPSNKYSFLKYYIPIYVPNVLINKPINARKMITMICSNKKSKHPLELYSERRKVIKYFESKRNIFDLYGFGWANEGYLNYRGTVDNKHEALSNYKFCVCFENVSNIRDNITEKIFDCFFSGCVPIYYGASNVQDLIPDDTYIDYRQFKSIEEMYNFIRTLSDEDIKKYIDAARIYLSSEQFMKTFYYENYVNVLLTAIYE